MQTHEAQTTPPPPLNMRLPEILSMPPKMLPMVHRFNEYNYLYAEGGRSSAKTHSVARFLLFLASKFKLRIVCGREIQNSIEESVYTVFCDLIEQYSLPCEITSKKIVHRISGSVFTFKGFREQNAVSVKGLEGVDILWIDEAQSVTKTTLDVVIPTIRKAKSKVIFTMNRFMRDDAVHEFCEGRKDCLHIHIDYFDNPFCPLKIKAEAETMRIKSQRDYDHIYLGKPLTAASDYLFNYDFLHSAIGRQPMGDLRIKQRVMAIDFAAQGDDQCVATVLDRASPTHWKVFARVAWDEADAMVSVGRIVNLVGQYKPDVSILDVGGMGHVVHNRLTEVGVNIQRFDGATTDGVDTTHYGNARAQGYFETADWFEQGFLCLTDADRQTLKELEKIRFKYRSSGVRMIQPKVDMKKDLGYSPDSGDSLMMAVWAARHMLGNYDSYLNRGSSQVERKTTHKRR